MRQRTSQRTDRPTLIGSFALVLMTVLMVYGIQTPPAVAQMDANNRGEHHAQEHQGHGHGEHGDAHKDMGKKMRCCGQGMACCGGHMSVDRAVAVIRSNQNAQGEIHGVVRFEQQDDGVKVTIHVKGLEPGSVHGFHIHQYGDLTSGDGSSLGGHYNPEGHEHNLPNGEPRHAGDLGNIEADDQGVVHQEMTVDNITIAGKKNPVLGRGVIVHALRDTGEGASGEAGARIATGVIGIANPDATNK